MRLRTRFTLIGIFIVIFLILAPWIVFYALGYQYDFKTGSVVKTGSLVIETKPEDALVYLNDKLLDKDTPLTIRFLVPGDYQVRVEKTGFQPWSKRLNVKQQLVTWANLERDFIPLFLDQPQLVQTFTADRTSVAKNRDAVGLASSQQLQILWADSGTVQTAGNYTATDFVLPIEWENTNQIFYLNRLNLLTAKQAAEIRSIQTNGAFVALDIGGDLYLIRTGELVLIEKAISAFDLEANGLWFVKNSSLKHYSLDTTAVQILSERVPDSKNAQVHLLGNKVYAILDNSLYVLNDEFEKIHAPVSYISWSAAGGLILISNSNELTVYNPARKSTELVFRSSTPVSQGIINHADGYIFFVHEGQLKAIELDGRDQRNVYTIFKQFDAQNKFTLSDDGKFIYVISPDKVEKYLIR